MTRKAESVSDADISTRVDLRQRTGTGSIAMAPAARDAGGGPGGGGPGGGQARFPEKPAGEQKTKK